MAGPSGPRRGKSKLPQIQARQKSDDEYKDEWDAWARTEGHYGAEDVADLVKNWLEAGNPDAELDLSGEDLSTLASIPHNAQQIDISNNRLTDFPMPSAGATSINAASNQITRIRDSALDAIFRLAPHCYIDLQNNPLDTDLITTIRQRTAASGYSGPTIMITVPAGMGVDTERVLIDVDKSKPVAFLPLSKLPDVQATLGRLASEGVSTLVVSHDEGIVESGAVYAYDAPGLSALLNLPENRQVLDRYGLSADPGVVARYVATTRIDQRARPDLAALIDKMFGWDLRG